MKILLRILASLLCVSSYGQTQDLALESLRSVHEQQKFPFVIYKSHPKVAEKINTFLQLTYLENIPDTSIENPFEIVEESYRTNFESWDRYKTIEKIMTIEISGNGTGAYTSYFTKHHNFDLSTGNVILLEGFFTTEGLNKIDSIVRCEIKSTINFFLETAKPASESVDDIEAHEMQISEYQYCYESIDSGDLKEYYDFYFSNDSIFFVKGRCFPHVIRGLDDLGAFISSFNFEEIKSYLSDYGKSLLAGGTPLLSVQTPNKKIFKGFINGKYPISMLIEEIYSDKSLRVFYWYDKERKPIRLDGRFVNNHFSLLENDYYSEAERKWIPRAHIEADWIHNQEIMGVWIDYKTKEKLSFELSLY